MEWERLAESRCLLETMTSAEISYSNGILHGHLKPWRIIHLLGWGSTDSGTEKLEEGELRLLLLARKTYFLPEEKGASALLWVMHEDISQFRWLHGSFTTRKIKSSSCSVLIADHLLFTRRLLQVLGRWSTFRPTFSGFFPLRSCCLHMQGRNTSQNEVF